MLTIPSLSAAKDALSLLSQITDLTKAAMTIELKEKILELREALVDQSEEALSLREQNAKLKSQLELRNQLKYDAPNYYLSKSDGTKDGPFCQVCSDKDNKLMRLKTLEEGSWNCGGCGQHFETKERHIRSVNMWNNRNSANRDIGFPSS